MKEQVCDNCMYAYHEIILGQKSAILPNWVLPQVYCEITCQHRGGLVNISKTSYCSLWRGK